MIAVNLTTCQEYAEARGCAIPTVTQHARQLGIEKIAGRYLFSPEQVERLDKSIRKHRGRPRRDE